MKISVLEIDYDKLDYNVQAVQSSNDSDVYLFMNAETAELLSHDECFNHTASSLAQMTYCGSKVYIDNDLKVGEVDLR